MNILGYFDILTHMKTLLLYVCTVPVFLVFDIVFLGVIAKAIYAKYLGPFMRDPVLWPVAIAFYLLYVGGLLFFAVIPGLKANSWQYAALSGAFLGFIVYMTYEFTNWSIIKNWPWQIVPIDIIWGIVLGAIVALISWHIGKVIGF